MQNQTLIQYFHWYYNEADNLWVKAAKEAGYLKNLGITTVWFPPANKGSNGGYSVGYDSYDLYDLGEFDQKNSKTTKYGNKEEYLIAIQALHDQQIGVLADIVFNHKAGGDELETIRVRKVNEENREEFISEEIGIEAWTKFTFPGRNGQYSDFIWDYQCFSGVDWAQNLNESAIFFIQNEYGESWEKVPSTEFGNYDYLMFNDLEFRNEAVLMSNADEGFKEMEIGSALAGKTVIDALGNREEEVMLDENGKGEFYCNGASVSVWVLKV